MLIAQVANFAQVLLVQIDQHVVGVEELKPGSALHAAQIIERSFGLTQVIAAQIIYKTALRIVGVTAQCFLFFPAQSGSRIRVEVAWVGLGKGDGLIEIGMHQIPIVALCGLAGALLENRQFILVSLLDDGFQFCKTSVLVAVIAQQLTVFTGKSAQVAFPVPERGLTTSLCDGVFPLLVNDVVDVAVQLLRGVIAVEANGVTQLRETLAVIKLPAAVQYVLDFCSGGILDFIIKIEE